MAAAVVIGLIVILVGLRASNQPFAGSLHTDFAQFTTNQPFETYELVVRDIRVGFRGSLSGPPGDSAADDIEGERQVLTIIATSPTTTEPILPIATLQKIRIPEATQVYLSTDSASDEIDLIIRGGDVELTILPHDGASLALENPFCIADGNCPQARFRTEDGPVRISGDGQDDIQITLTKAQPKQPIADVALVSEFKTSQVIESSVGPLSRSGLSDGTLKFANAPDNTREIFPGEVIDLAGESMILRSVVAESDGLAAQISGELNEATARIGKSKVSLMPTWFDVISNDPRTRYLVGAISILIGLMQVFGWEKLLRWRERA